MKISTALVGIWLLCVVHWAKADQQSDYVEITRQSVDLIGRYDYSIQALIPPDDIDAQLNSALSAVDRVVPRNTLPKSNKNTLPKGYLIIEHVRIKGSTGKFVGVAGPGTLKSTHGAPEDCGTRYEIPFHRKDGKWEIGETYQHQACEIVIDDPKEAEAVAKIEYEQDLGHGFWLRTTTDKDSTGRKRVYLIRQDRNLGISHDHCVSPSGDHAIFLEEKSSALQLLSTADNDTKTLTTDSPGAPSLCVWFEDRGEVMVSFYDHPGIVTYEFGPTKP